VKWTVSWIEGVAWAEAVTRQRRGWTEALIGPAGSAGAYPNTARGTITQGATPPLGKPCRGALCDMCRKPCPERMAK